MARNGIRKYNLDIHMDPTNVVFSIFTAEEIKTLSVAKIYTPLTFNALGNPIPGGLYDPCLGPLGERSDPCQTCYFNILSCPGHIGHIELPLPVINPLFHNIIRSILKVTCITCFRLQITDHVNRILLLQLKLVNSGHVKEAQDLDVYMGIDPADKENYPEDLFKQYEKLTENSNFNEKNKNIEGVRSNFISTIIKQVQLKKTCIHCKQQLIKVSGLHNKLLIQVVQAENEETLSKPTKSSMTLLFPEDCREYFRKLWKQEKGLLEEIISVLKYNKNSVYPTDLMFFEVIAVPPPNVRPVNYMNNRMIEHPQTQVYKAILNTCTTVRAILQCVHNDPDVLETTQVVFNGAMGQTGIEKLNNAWQQLQANIDHLMDIEMNKITAKVDGHGLKQIMEKKEGIIRMHMMGKRVNFAARSVITPDPNLNIDEIGVPEAFAKKLSYPVPVTLWNVTELRKMVMNGPDVHPGAVMIENEDGSLIKIPSNEITKQESIAKRLLTPSENSNRGVKIVHRHLCNGDILLLNRQPTLHRPSIMAHKARILPGEKTLRLHYANCKAYNADFDGDEMNAHFPQNELARSEGYNLVNVCNQYLVPKDGTPLSGLIQDHMISGVRLSMRGRFFTKEDYQMLVFSALVNKQGDIKLLPPTIIKPVKLWSGKQVISTLIINNIPRTSLPLTLKSTAKIPANAWQTQNPRHWLAGGTPFKSPIDMTEAEVIIQKGELLCGVLDKTHYGSTPYGLIHCMYELYGGAWSNKLLSSFAKLFTTFLQREGFTLGVHDILVLKEADEERSNIILETREVGPLASAEAVSLSPDVSKEELIAAVELAHSNNPKFRAIIDRKYKQTLDNYTNRINKTCLPAGLLCKFPYNNLQLMVQSGAKGSTVNTMQISCLLGQIELEGKRPPVMISGKSLPSFPAFEPSPRAGGFIDGRFMTGIQPQEFFFHCMAGREGLIDTAVKTSRSGYLQRCLIKHLEGLTVKYDLTVRDSDNSVIQFLYGEDGMDISKVQFLKNKLIPFLNDNSDIILDKKVVQKFYDEGLPDDLMQSAKELRRWKKKYGDPLKKDRTSIFAQYSKKYLPEEDSIEKAHKKSKMTGRTRLTKKIIKMWRQIPKDEKENLKLKLKTLCPDPVISKYQPDHYFGVLNEKLECLMKDYLKTRETKEEFEDMIKFKAMTTLCEPGEPVGLLAAQSIGEPSTQMTLNTFHFAGRGEMNVTLGIPRLKEILMTASKEIKTPCMDIPFRESVSEHFSETEKLRKRLVRVTIAEVLKSVQLHRIMAEGHMRKHKYTIKFEFLPHSAYKADFCVKPKGIIKFMELKFCPALMRAILKSSRSKQMIVVDDGAKSKRSKKNNDEEEPEEQSTKKKSGYKTFGEDYATSDEDEGIADDEDATNARKRTRKNDNQEYDVSEDEVIEESGNESEEKDLNETKPFENGNNEDDKMDTEIDGFSFDDKSYLRCKYVFTLGLSYSKLNLPEIIKTLAEKTVIFETPNIKRAITYKNNDGALVLKTDGINIVEMFKYNDILDLNKLYSNDVHCIAQTYGIEAAGRVIVKEVQNVFNVYGITVDPRHLLLIADYMTYDGTFQPLSRTGLETSVSPLQQMSYESSLTFLKQATLKGMQDDLNSPSSRLMLGQPCGTGTGTVSLFNSFSNVAFG